MSLDEALLAPIVVDSECSLTAAPAKAVDPSMIDGDDSDDPRHLTYKPAVAKAFFVVFLLFAGTLIPMLAVLPDEFVKFFNDGVSCNGAAAKRPDCKDAASKYSLVNGIATALGCFFTFLFSPLLGCLSDSYGRKKMVIFCAFWTLMQQGSLLLYVFADVSLYLYLALGIPASFDATSVLLAYISDVVPPSKRAFCNGLIFAAITLAIIGCPFIGPAVSVPTCFCIGFGVVCAYFLACVFLLPETLAMELRTPFTVKDLNPFRSFHLIARYSMFRRLAGVVFIGNFIERGKFAVNYMFLKTAFSATQQFYAYVAATFGVLGFLSQTIGLRLLITRLTNQKIMMVGLVACFLNMITSGRQTMRLARYE